MKCPVCGGEYPEGALFCTECGANLASFANVSPEKIINNQTTGQQEKLGDDSVTVLIPENYATAKGDDEQTVLIPENYATAKGDDERTVLLPEGSVPPKTANKPQPSFVQQGTVQPQGFVQQGMVQPQQGFVQQGMAQPQQGFVHQGMTQSQQGFVPQQNMNYQNTMQNMNRQPAVPVNTTMMKLFSTFSAISAAVTAVFIIVFLSNPIYYIFEHYIGEHPEFKEAWKSGELADANSMSEFVSTSGTYCIAALLALVACVVISVIGIVKSQDKITARPASLFPLMTLLTGVMGSGIMLFFKFFFGLGFKIGIEEASDGEDVERVIERYKMFNCYDWITVFIIVTVVVVIVNLIVAKTTESKWMKANNARFRR